MSRFLLLASTLVFAANSYADSLTCAEAYEAKSRQYTEQVEGFKMGALSGGVVAGVGAGGAALCFFTAPTVVPCVVVGAGALLAYGYRHEQLVDLELLEQQHKLNLIFKSIKSGTVKDSELVRDFVYGLGVDKVREEDTFGKVTWLIESGVLCERDEALVGLNDVARLLASPRTLF